jgi:hypothetical protein
MQEGAAVIQTFDFSEALRLMKRGYRVQRGNLPGSIEVDLQALYFRFPGVRDVRMVWTPIAEELLAEDWHLVDAEVEK